MLRLLAARRGVASHPTSLLTRSYSLNWNEPHPEGEPTSPPQPLALKLPDLTPEEESYVRSHLDLLRKFDSSYLEPCHEDKALALVRTDFPNFLTDGRHNRKGGGKRREEKYQRLKKTLCRSPLVAKRTSHALKLLGVTDEEMGRWPALAATDLSRLPNAAQERLLLEVPLIHLNRPRLHQPLRGKAVKSVVDDLVSSLSGLELLSGGEGEELVDKLRFTPRHCGRVTLDQLNQRAVAALVNACVDEEKRKDALKALSLTVRVSFMPHYVLSYCRYFLRLTWTLK